MRVEGASKTLLAETPVTIPDSGDIPGASTDCEWNEPAGPLEAGTKGDWDRSNFVQTILGENASGSKGWFVWVDGKYSSGNCYDTIREASEVLFTAGEYDSNFNPVDLPMRVREVPERVAPGQAFTVVAEQIQPEFEPGQPYYKTGTGSWQPAQGATITAGSVSATTDASGRATLSAAARGQLTVQATRGSKASRSKPVATCSTDGADGYCGTRTSSGQTIEAAPGGAPAAACVSSGLDGLCGSADRQPPKALVTGVREGQTFAAGSGPRELSGRVGVLAPFAPRAAVDVAALRPDPSGLLMVKLRLTRNDRGRCSAWSGKRERFVKRPCGARHGWWFRVGDKAEWSYLMPSRLPRGRYVLDVNAIDKAYNRDDMRRRGENRVVFRVR